MKESSKNEQSSIEEDVKILESIIKINNDYLKGVENQTINQKEIKALEHILQDYKKLQEEFKQVDHECERLEEKEVRLIKENEYYKDLINALETYYNITREDLEKCMKNDR